MLEKIENKRTFATLFEDRMNYSKKYNICQL